FSAKFALRVAAAFGLFSFIALAIVALAPHGETGFPHHLLWAYTSLPTLVLFRLSESNVVVDAPNLYSLLVVADNALLAGVAGFMLAWLFRFAITHWPSRRTDAP